MDNTDESRYRWAFACTAGSVIFMIIGALFCCFHLLASGIGPVDWFRNLYWSPPPTVWWYAARAMGGVLCGFFLAGL